MDIPSLFSVRDRVVIVTGAFRGNGKAIAEGFLAAGARVCFVDREPAILSQVKAYRNRKASALVSDLQDRNALDELLRIFETKFPRIDVLVNNAGVSLAGKDNYALDIYERTLSVNLEAAFRLAAQAARVMKLSRKGSIINITSLGAELGFPQNPAYQMTKAGLRQLSRAMARDFGEYGVRVNNVCPGYIRTRMTMGSYADKSKRNERQARIMLARWGEPEDLVGACIFLASDASAYITGADLHVDGGWSAKGL